MNKIAHLIFLLLLTTLVACSNDGEDVKEKEETTNESTEEQQEADKSDNDDEEAASVSKDENEATEDNGEDEDPQYELDDNWSVVPLEEDVNEEVVLLTIDDAPDDHALEMAQTLKDLDVNAIFFVNGHFLDTPEKQKQLKEIYDMGFMIGNHTFNHSFLPDLDEEQQKEEIVELNDVIEDIIGERPVFFRAPNGANTDYVKKVVKEEDMLLMNWSYGYDFQPDYQTREAITDIMLNTELLGNGANLLMHDREWTAEALEDIVVGLEDQGYEMVDPHLIKTD